MMDSAIWIADRRTVDAENPWPGLLSFGEADEAYFRGRDREAEALGRMVTRGRMTVLFGLSGLGKSSLLQAGLFPRLRRDNVLPVYVRLDYSAARAGLVSQITDAIAVQAAAAGVEAPEARRGEGLWEYLHRRGSDLWSPRNRPLLPLLVFDQFEEIFTLGRAHPGRADLMDALADLAEGRPPAALKARLDDHPEEAEGFAFGRHHYKLLLALREDYLPDLEVLRERISAVALNRLRLRRMDGSAALAVVRQGGELVSPEVAERVVRFVAKAQADDTPLAELQVEPALLSVVCRELNNQRLERGDAAITAGLLEGSAEQILSGFYERAVAEIRPAVRAFVEEELLVEGYRDSVALEKALGVPGVDRQALDQLVDRRLVRIDPRDGVERLELTHDLLTDVIAASRDRRRRREVVRRDLEARQEAEEREQQARRKLRRSRLYSALLAAAVILSLAAVFYATQKSRALERSTLKLELSQKTLKDVKERALESQQAFQAEADEAATTIAELKKALSEAISEREKREAALQELLDKVQKSPEVEQQLEEVEQAREDADLKARQIISIADKRLTAYSTVRKQSVLVNVVLDSVGKDKISVIKLVRTFTSLGLKESKELVDSAPITIMEAVSSKEAEGIQSRLEAAGAKVELEPVRIKK